MQAAQINLQPKELGNLMESVTVTSVTVILYTWLKYKLHKWRDQCEAA